MPKNVVFFADGTGNDRAHGVKTNVAKLCDVAINMRTHRGGKTWQELEGAALDQELSQPGIEQITHYDAGVGTGMTGRIMSWLSAATGSGISQNIKDGYHFVVQFYEPGDRIFLFGFSRGAYTVRSLAGLIGLCGVARRSQDGADLRHDPKQRTRIVDEAYAVYKTGTVDEDASEEEREAGRQKRLEAGKRFRKERAYPEHREPEARAPYFIGVWDTVRSLGIPIGGRDLEIQFWPHRFHDHDLNEYVSYAYHALAIDDRREAFHPTIWNEPTKAQLTAQRTGQPVKQVFEQVWFAGVHCDVGGGYEESGLSDASLAWMMDKASAAEHPLLLAPGARAGLRPLDKAKIHDSRDAFWKKVLYRERVRSVCKGSQEPGRTPIAPLQGTHADLHQSWVSVIGTLYDGYNPVNMKPHPDYLLAIEQLGPNARPPTGPWKHVR
jgi:uncharacterized protein (DUF2235 family)